MKRVLYFFPDNPTSRHSGNRTWAKRLLHYFKDRGMQVELVSTKYWSNDWDEESANWLFQNKLISKLHFIRKKPSKKNIAYYFIIYKLPLLFKKLFQKKGALPDQVTFQMQQDFNQVLKSNNFDYIVISYAHWANLIKNNPLIGKAKTLIDTHDFLTSIYQTNKHFKLGAFFEEEMKRLSMFDEIWAVSTDERYLFTQFCQESIVRLVTTNLDRFYPHKKPAAQCEYDLIYVASDNPANKRSVHWFFEQVYPLLPQTLSICVIGKICNYVPNHTNIIKVPFAPTLLEYYSNAKIAICPILSGTGIKIKVVEAMAHGLPIAGTMRALDGLPNKVANGCLVHDDPGIFAKNINALLSDEQLYLKQQQQAIELYELCFSSEVGRMHLDEAFGNA